VSAGERAGTVRLLLVPVLVVLGLVGLYEYVAVTHQFDPYILNGKYVSLRLLQHVQIAGLSFALALVIGVPAGVALSTRGRALRKAMRASTRSRSPTARNSDCIGE